MSFEPKRHEEILYGENIEGIKTHFVSENEEYNALILSKVEKFTEKDSSEFKSFLISFLKENRKAIDDFFLSKYLSKAKTFDIQVIFNFLFEKYGNFRVFRQHHLIQNSLICWRSSNPKNIN